MIIPTAHIIILLITGSGVGFAIGLLGLGGGPILIPVQYMLFTNTGISADIAVRMAFGISGSSDTGKFGIVEFFDC